jgi:hypothetical protein
MLSLRLLVNSHSVRTPFARRRKAQVSCQKVLSQLCAGVDGKTVISSLTCPIPGIASYTSSPAHSPPCP